MINRKSSSEPGLLSVKYAVLFRSSRTSEFFNTIVLCVVHVRSILVPASFLRRYGILASVLAPLCRSLFASVCPKCRP